MKRSHNSAFPEDVPGMQLTKHKRTATLNPDMAFYQALLSKLYPLCQTVSRDMSGLVPIKPRFMDSKPYNHYSASSHVAQKVSKIVISTIDQPIFYRAGKLRYNLKTDRKDITRSISRNLTATFRDNHPECNADKPLDIIPLLKSFSLEKPDIHRLTNGREYDVNMIVRSILKEMLVPKAFHAIDQPSLHNFIRSGIQVSKKKGTFLADIHPRTPHRESVMEVKGMHNSKKLLDDLNPYSKKPPEKPLSNLKPYFKKKFDDVYQHGR